MCFGEKYLTSFLDKNRSNNWRINQERIIKMGLLIVGFDLETVATIIHLLMGVHMNKSCIDGIFGTIFENAIEQEVRGKWHLN